MYLKLGERTRRRNKTRIPTRVRYTKENWAPCCRLSQCSTHGHEVNVLENFYCSSVALLVQRKLPRLRRQLARSILLFFISMWRLEEPEEPSSQLLSLGPSPPPSATSEQALPSIQRHGPLPSLRTATTYTTVAAAPTPAVEETFPRSSSPPAGACSSHIRHQPSHFSASRQPIEGNNHQPLSSWFPATNTHTINENIDNNDEAPRSKYSSCPRSPSSPQRIDGASPDNDSLMLFNNPQPLHTNRWASPCFFFLGSVLFFWTALYDIRQESTWDKYDDAKNDDADTDDADEEMQQQPLVNFYVILSSCAALCYVLDAVCSFVHFPKWMGLPFQLVCCGRLHYHTHHNHHHGATADVQHGEETNGMWPLAVSGTFGLAALLDLASSLTVNWTLHPQMTNVCAIGAVYVYLLNAATLLFSKKEQQQHPQVDDNNSSLVVTILSRSELLEHRGDILFGIGSCIDVALSSVYFSHSVSNAQWKLVNRANLLSTILWLLDSLLYIAAEYYSDDSDNDDDIDQNNASILVDRLEGSEEGRTCLTSAPVPALARGNSVAEVAFTPTLEEPLLADDDSLLASPIFSSSMTATPPAVVTVLRPPRNAAAAADMEEDEANSETTAKSIGVLV